MAEDLGRLAVDLLDHGPLPMPSLALLVRRVHDIGMSGWFAAVIFLPYIGGLIALIFTFIPTQMRANAHGPAPVANIPR